MLAEGTLAPPLRFVTTAGTKLSLVELRGAPVVLFFFPKAFTPGCSVEAGQFRDAKPELEKHGARTFGISTDDLDTQCKFSEKFGVELIADPYGDIVETFGVAWPILRRARRITYVIDAEGRIAAVISHELRVSLHVEETLEALTRLAKK